jgi:hypothetical protein
MGPWVAKELGYSGGIGCSGLAGAFTLLAIAYNVANPRDETYRDYTGVLIWFAVFTFVMAMIFVGTMIAKSRSSSERERQKEAWTEGELRLANAWYCERDDVLFDDALHAVPEGFIAEAFGEMWTHGTEAGTAQRSADDPEKEELLSPSDQADWVMAGKPGLSTWDGVENFLDWLKRNR